VLLHALLSGTLPFAASTEAGTYAAILGAPLDLSSSSSPSSSDEDDDVWRGVSEGAKDLLRALLRRDPEGRLTAAQALCALRARMHACAARVFSSR
jgi:serine/threonine protein kinase